MMQIKFDELSAHFEQGIAAPLYLLHGDEPLLINEASDAWRQAAYTKGYRQRKILVVERGFDWSELFAAVQSLSLFGERMLIELRMPSSKPGKENAEALKEYASIQAANTDNAVALITFPYLDLTTQKTAWFATLAKIGITVKIEKIEGARLTQWIIQRLATQGHQLENGIAGKQALQFLLERVEGNLLAAHQEIQKLGLLYPPGILSSAQIQEAVLNVARYDIFKLPQAMLEGNLPRLIRILDGLQGEGVAAVLVLWVVTEEIRLLCKLQNAIQQGQKISELMRANRIWGVRERLIPEALERISVATLQSALLLAAQLDRQVKGLVPLTAMPNNIWEGLLQLACTLLPNKRGLHNSMRIAC